MQQYEKILYSDGYGAFPDTSLADEDGLLAIGATLATDRLIDAYHNGIFPWYNEGDPIYWYAPPQRCVVYPSHVKISKSMKSILKKGTFTCTRNQDFETIIHACAHQKRSNQSGGTWIHQDMIDAYIELHRQGWAHSIEVRQDKQIVGGLYGIEINKLFCGESMFSKVSNASKVAFIHLCQAYHYDLIDCQIPNNHLLSLGAVMISREEFEITLKKI